MIEDISGFGMRLRGNEPDRKGSGQGLSFPEPLTVLTPQPAPPPTNKRNKLTAAHSGVTTEVLFNKLYLQTTTIPSASRKVLQLYHYTPSGAPLHPHLSHD